MSGVGTVSKTKELKSCYGAEQVKNQTSQFRKEPSHASGSSFQRAPAETPHVPISQLLLWFFAAGGLAAAGGGGTHGKGSSEITPVAVDPTISFQDVGGLGSYVKALKEMVRNSNSKGPHYQLPGCGRAGLLRQGAQGDGTELQLKGTDTNKGTE
jgi:hypothetical protein